MVKLVRTLFAQTFNVIEGERAYKTFASIFQCFDHHSSRRAAWTAKMKRRKAFSVSSSASKVPIPLSSSLTFSPRIPVVIHLLEKEKIHFSFVLVFTGEDGAFPGDYSELRQAAAN